MHANLWNKHRKQRSRQQKIDRSSFALRIAVEIVVEIVMVSESQNLAFVISITNLHHKRLSSFIHSHTGIIIHFYQPKIDRSIHKHRSSFTDASSNNRRPSKFFSSAPRLHSPVAIGRSIIDHATPSEKEQARPSFCRWQSKQQQEPTAPE